MTKPPTGTEEGIRTYCCQRCGLELRTETIPSIGGGDQPGGEQGNIDKDVETDGKAPDTQLFAPAAELADIILTEGEKQQVQSGTDIKIILDVKDATGIVSNEDQALINAALDDLTTTEDPDTENKFTVGQHLDIGLFKVIGGNRSAISETAQKITITIAVPESLKSADGGRTRTFAVIRVHNGQVQLLEDLDSNEDTITIATDRFSTYTIVYRDGADNGNGNGGNGGTGSGDDGNDGTGSGDGNGGNGGTGSGDSGNVSSDNSSNAAKTGEKDAEPKTGDSILSQICVTFAMTAGFACLLLHFISLGRQKKQRNS